MSSSEAQLATALALIIEAREEPTLRSEVITRLADVCVRLFPESIGTGWKGEPDREGAKWALANALRAYALPPSPRDAERLLHVARSISAAMTAREVTLTHICPLDLADYDLPTLRFGPCEVRSFSRSEFEDLIEWQRLRRQFTTLQLDTAAFAQFHWLIVREQVRLPSRVGKRSLPFLSWTLDKDFGEITPHQSTWPEIVNHAVFALLLLPWESVVGYKDLDWRAFRIPWVYTINPDPFTSPKWPPSPLTLSWEPDIFDDPSTGETIELEKPTRLPLQDGADAMCSALTDGRWNEIMKAMNAPIFNPLVEHFLVRAFTSDAIDEFLSHAIVVEAAIGMEADYRQKKGTTKPEPRLSATKRVAKRTAMIIGDANAVNEYEELFDLRSAFVHGRQLGAISSTKRMLARSLARRVANSLVSAALAGSHTDRDAFLSALCP